MAAAYKRSISNSKTILNFCNKMGSGHVTTQNNMPSLRTNRRRLATAYISIDSYLTIGLLISQEL